MSALLGYGAPVGAAGLGGGVALVDQLERGAVAPGLGEGLGEDLGGLGPRDAVLAVQDEEGDAVGTELGGLALVGADVVGVGGGVGEDLADLVGVQAGLDGELDKALVALGVQGPLLGEVGPVEDLDELVLPALFLGEVEEPVQVEGVAVVAVPGPVGEPSAVAWAPRFSSPACAWASLMPYFLLSIARTGCTSLLSRPGSSSNDRWTTSTPSRCGKASSAFSKRALPT